MEPVQDAPPAVSTTAQVAVIAQLSGLARQNPRDEGLALQRTLARVDDTSWWKVPNRGEGASVKIARTAFQRYGNAATLPNVRDIGDQWEITILGIDMETMAISSSVGTVMKPEKRANEKPQAYIQRCFQAQLAFIGRLERNLIFKVLPGDWEAQIEAKYREHQKAKPLAERVPILIDGFKRFGVLPKHLKKRLGVDETKMSEAQFGELRDLYNALHNGDTTVEEAFGIPVGKDDTQLRRAMAVLKPYADAAEWTENKLRATLRAASDDMGVVAESFEIDRNDFWKQMEADNGDSNPTD